MEKTLFRLETPVAIWHFTNTLALIGAAVSDCSDLPAEQLGHLAGDLSCWLTMESGIAKRGDSWTFADGAVRVECVGTLDD